MVVKGKVYKRWKVAIGIGILRVYNRLILTVGTGITRELSNVHQSKRARISSFSHPDAGNKGKFKTRNELSLLDSINERWGVGIIDCT
jgi:hypothetical protein